MNTNFGQLLHFLLRRHSYFLARGQAIVRLKDELLPCFDAGNHLDPLGIETPSGLYLPSLHHAILDQQHTIHSSETDQRTEGHSDPGRIRIHYDRCLNKSARAQPSVLVRHFALDDE
jgi:hypothetical protein